ncbi:MAG: signal peptide peptidase SppA [Acidobacteriia bacterium]|nr:signal peptide peptidase SppA [Terriglobia bacterium]
MANGGRSRGFLWVLIGGGAFFIFVLAVYTLVYVALRAEQGTQYVVTGSGEQIAVVDIDGVILDAQSTVRDLKKFADDTSIKAIIIHLNTPGGSAAASEEIYREVRRIRDDKKKRIVADIAVVGASGGYYVASGTNKIFANDASVVGSIGAIMDWYNYGDLVRWAKLKEEVIKSGEFKDTGDPARELTPVERAYLQGMVNNMKDQFVAAIASGRGLKAEDVSALADGRVWTGQQALTLKLVDQIGDFEAAVKDTAKAVGIKGEPSLVRPAKERHSLLDLIFGDASQWLPDRSKLMQRNPGFYFLWK